MLRTEQRRRERRHIARTRVLAVATTVALSLGIAVGGTAVATANPNDTLSTPIVNAGGVKTYDQNGLTCSGDLIGYSKPGALDGSNLDNDGTYTAPWGSISWDVSERTVTWSILAGWDVDVCVKGGTHLSTIDTSATDLRSYTHNYAGLSHLGFFIVSTPTATPVEPTVNRVSGCGTYGSIEISDIDNPFVSYTVYRGSADENGSVANLPTVDVQDATNGVFTVVATAVGDAVFAPKAERQWEFDLGEFEPCPPGVTNATIGFIDATCETGQQLDPTTFLVADAELARYAPELSSLTGSTYSVVFVITDDDTVFDDSAEPQPGRMVSNDGKTLTFTGTLLGVDVADCDPPTLANWPASVSTSPEDCVLTRLVNGTIDVVFPVVPDGDPAPIRYYVDYEGPDEVELTEASTSFPAGNYVVTAAVTNALDSVNNSGQTATFPATVDEFDGVCDPPTLANWDVEVTGSNERCETVGLVSGAITVDGPAGNPNPVRYFINYDEPGEQELTNAVTPVAAGTYTVTAITTDPDDSINDDGNTAEFEVTVGAAADQDCDLDTLAITGTTSAVAGLGAASLLLILVGLGALAVRRQRV